MTTTTNTEGRHAVVCPTHGLVQAYPATAAGWDHALAELARHQDRDLWGPRFCPEADITPMSATRVRATLAGQVPSGPCCQRCWAEDATQREPSGQLLGRACAQAQAAERAAQLRSMSRRDQVPAALHTGGLSFRVVAR